MLFFRADHGGDVRGLRVLLQAVHAHEQFLNIVLDHSELLGLAQQRDQVIISDELEAREVRTLFLQLGQQTLLDLVQLLYLNGQILLFQHVETLQHEFLSL